MTASEDRAHPSPFIPMLLVGVMSLLALGAAILAVVTGGSTSTGSSGAGTAHPGSLIEAGVGPGDIGAAPVGPAPTSVSGSGRVVARDSPVRLTWAGGPVQSWYRADPRLSVSS